MKQIESVSGCVFAAFCQDLFPFLYLSSVSPLDRAHGQPLGVCGFGDLINRLTGAETRDDLGAFGWGDFAAVVFVG